MTKEEILVKALDRMPENFTSRNFSNEACKLGFPREDAYKGDCGRFLHKYAIQGFTQKTWSKSKSQIHTFEGLNVLLDKTLDEMPQSFSSNVFGKIAIKNGVAKCFIENRYVLNYLRANANRGSSKRTWYKKTQGKTSIKTPIKTQEPYQLNETKCIEFLKERGYKIMKPVNEWKEI